MNTRGVGRILDSYANPPLSRVCITPLVFISGYANTENVFYCLINLVLDIDPKGLDSSNNIDSRINITTFFNLPDMLRRYIRHLQCYIF